MHSERVRKFMVYNGATFYLIFDCLINSHLLITQDNISCLQHAQPENDNLCIAYKTRFEVKGQVDSHKIKKNKNLVCICLIQHNFHS